jgi:hypothetical protein
MYFITCKTMVRRAYIVLPNLFLTAFLVSEINKVCVKWKPLSTYSYSQRRFTPISDKVKPPLTRVLWSLTCFDTESFRNVVLRGPASTSLYIKMCEFFYFNPLATRTPFATWLLFLPFKLNISNLLCIYFVTHVHGGRSRHKLKF